MMAATVQKAGLSITLLDVAFLKITANLVTPKAITKVQDQKIRLITDLKF